MIIGLADVTNSLTTAVSETPFIDVSGDDQFQRHTNDGASLTYTVQYDQGRLVQAINEWTHVVAAATSATTYTYANISGAGADYAITLHASTGDDFTTNNTLVFDMGGWPPSVAATFTVTSGTNSVTTWGTSLNTCLEKKQIGGFAIWVPREMTDEEKAAEAVRAAEFERQQQVFLAEQKAADEKAETLLRKILTPKQRMELETEGHFHVWAKDGFKYRITRSSGHNVSRVCPETGRVLARYCIVPKIFVPSSDRLLAQKLLLEADPERFISLSNVYKS